MSQNSTNEDENDIDDVGDQDLCDLLSNILAEFSLKHEQFGENMMMNMTEAEKQAMFEEAANLPLDDEALEFNTLFDNAARLVAEAGVRCKPTLNRKWSETNAGKNQRETFEHLLKEFESSFGAMATLLSGILPEELNNRLADDLNENGQNQAQHLIEQIKNLAQQIKTELDSEHPEESEDYDLEKGKKIVDLLEAFLKLTNIL